MTDERGHWKSMKLKRLEKKLALVEYGTGPRVLYSYILSVADPVQGKHVIRAHWWQARQCISIAAAAPVRALADYFENRVPYF